MKAAALPLALTLALAPPTATATTQDGPQPHLQDGETIEVELRADLNDDGIPDLAYVSAQEDTRELRVVTSYRGEVDFGANPEQVLALDAYPLADATLSLKDNPRGKVLMLEELSGGTTATFSTHRFRWDEALGAMRLIGLDAMLYSRTYAHDARQVSWNLLTGDLVTGILKLNTGGGDAAYAKAEETRTKKPSPPLQLEKSPSGDDLLGWPGVK